MPDSSPTDGPAPGPLGRLLDALDRVAAILAAVMAWAGAAVLLGLTGVIFYGVVRRYVFGTPVTWTDELAGYATVLLVMLGAAEAMRRHENVEVDLLTTRLGRRAARLTALWSTVVVIVVAAVLLHGGLEMVSFARMVGLISDGYLEMPMWIPQASLALGMAALLAVAGIRLLRLLAGREAPHHGRAARNSEDQPS